MNIRNRLITALAAVAMTAAGSYGQQILTKSDSGGAGFASTAGYADGDLVLAFMNAGDGSASGNVLFDLGSATSFTGLAPGTYSVAGFNGSATAGQPTPGFGSTVLSANETVPSGNTYWAVMGSLPGTTHQLWLTGQSAQTSASFGAQGTTGSLIQGGGASGAPNADSSAFDSTQTFGNIILPTNRWAGYPALTDNTVSATSNSLGLYSLIPAGSSTLLGTFTLTDTAGAFSLSFTAIPEPSTYAAILGALTVGFVLVRRRFGASRLNALA